jgi:hypothetical protein
MGHLSFDFSGHAARNPEAFEPLPQPECEPEPLAIPQLPPVDPAEPSVHVRYAYSPRQSARSNGGYHYVLDQPFDAGRLRRQSGDALCEPARRFWGLEPSNSSTTATCVRCLERASRYGLLVRTLDGVHKAGADA